MKKIIILAMFFIGISAAQGKIDSANVRSIDLQLVKYEDAMKGIQNQNEQYQKLMQKNSEDYLRLDGIRLFLLEQRKAEIDKIDSLKASKK